MKKDNIFAIKINLLVFGTIAIITLGSQFSQPQAAEAFVGNTYILENTQRVQDPTSNREIECSILRKDIEKYTTLAEDNLIKHDYEKAKEIFDYKLSPKHNKWKRYCRAIHKDIINEVVKNNYVVMQNKFARI